MLPIEKSPHDEVRFTRNAQAVTFFLLSLAFGCAGMALYLLSLKWSENTEPVLDASWYGLLVLPFVVGFAWWGMRLAKHAFLLFTPLGIELFPFWRPSKNLQVFYWSEVEEIDLQEGGRFLHLVLKSEGDCQVFIATDPLNKASRALLERTVTGVAERRRSATAA